MKPRTAMLKDKKKCPILNIEENFYFWEKDVKAAVEWLMRAFPSMPLVKHEIFCEVVREAFPDLFEVKP